MANLKKAVLIPIKNDKEGAPIEVLFNPAEYTIERTNQYQGSALPGLENPIHEFVSGESDTLALELFFDTYTDGGREDVTKLTGQIADLMDIDASMHAPPLVKFVWGRFQFTAILEKLSQKFTMFLDDGTPVRATLGVSLKQYKTVNQQLKSIARESSDRTKRRLISEGDSLWFLAAEEYRDPARWKWIAESNQLENPRLLQIGRELRLPPLE